MADLPTLIVAEAVPNGDGHTPAFLSRIERVRDGDKEVLFQFRHLYGRLSSERVFGLDGLHFDEREHSRTHWAVKEGDLLERLLDCLDQALGNPSPRVFTVSEWPLPPLGHVAVMMPFEAEFDAVHVAIKAACGDLKLRTLRVDQIYGPAKIMDDVFSTIAQSRAVVCDLTGRNPNVLYETGLAHALDRTVVTIVRDEHDVPFDLRHIRFLRYLHNNEGLEQLRVELRESLREVLSATVG